MHRSKNRVLEAGGVAAIPGGVEHEGWCHEDTEVVDIFAPPREDILAGAEPTWLSEKKLKVSRASTYPQKRTLPSAAGCPLCMHDLIERRRY